MFVARLYVHFYRRKFRLILEAWSAKFLHKKTLSGTCRCLEICTTNAKSLYLKISFLLSLAGADFLHGDPAEWLGAAHIITQRGDPDLLGLATPKQASIRSAKYIITGSPEKERVPLDLGGSLAQISWNSTALGLISLQYLKVVFWHRYDVWDDIRMRHCCQAKVTYITPWGYIQTWLTLQQADNYNLAKFTYAMCHMERWEQFSTLYCNRGPCMRGKPIQASAVQKLFGSGLKWYPGKFSSIVARHRASVHGRNSNPQIDVCIRHSKATLPAQVERGESRFFDVFQYLDPNPVI